jgi:DNA-binding GntR family transcriptional regulator
MENLFYPELTIWKAVERFQSLGPVRLDRRGAIIASIPVSAMEGGVEALRQLEREALRNWPNITNPIPVIYFEDP